MSPVEKRFGATVFEVRDDDANGITLTGYASTFNEPYDMGWYTETVAPGAFKRTLGRKPDVALLINHGADGGLPLARTLSGTLTLDTDSRGLLVRANLDPSDPDVARLAPKMRRGDADRMSFAFRLDGDEGDAWAPDFSTRTLRALELNHGDVSVVTNPANPHTSASIRSAGGAQVEAITSAMRALETRGASEEDIVSVLTRALGYFTAIDTIVDNAQAELAEALSIPNPDDDESAPEDDSARHKALAELEQRLRIAQSL